MTNNQQKQIQEYQTIALEAADDINPLLYLGNEGYPTMYALYYGDKEGVMKRMTTVAAIANRYNKLNVLLHNDMLTYKEIAMVYDTEFGIVPGDRGRLRAIVTSGSYNDIKLSTYICNKDLSAVFFVNVNPKDTLELMTIFKHVNERRTLAGYGCIAFSVGVASNKVERIPVDAMHFSRQACRVFFVNPNGHAKIEKDRYPKYFREKPI